jgi:four helix bundle protein
MTPDQMRARTDKFSVDIITFCRSLPPDPFTRRIALQLHDAGTSVAANYHAACRAQTRAQFIAKLSIALEEADECVGWLHKLAVTQQASGPPSQLRGKKPAEINQLLIVDVTDI